MSPTICLKQIVSHTPGDSWTQLEKIMPLHVGARMPPAPVLQTPFKSLLSCLSWPPLFIAVPNVHYSPNFTLPVVFRRPHFPEMPYLPHPCISFSATLLTASLQVQPFPLFEADLPLMVWIRFAPIHTGPCSIIFPNPKGVLCSTRPFL